MADAYCNHNRNTCIVYSEGDGLVFAVQMQSPELGLLEMGSEQFHRQWTLLEADAKAAASKYLGGYIPYSPEIKSILEKIVMGTKKAVVAGAAKTEPTQKKSAAAAKKTAEFFNEAEKKVEAAKPVKEPKAKAEKAAKEPKAKAEKAAKAPKEDLTNKKIKLLPLPEGKRFQTGSVRATCYGKIKDGMTVKTYLAATAKADVEDKVAIDCLKKLALVTQKYPTVQLVD